MFWIHGGAFFSGSSSQYPPEYLMDKNVVLVSTNYRLGVYGKSRCNKMEFSPYLTEWLSNEFLILRLWTVHTSLVLAIVLRGNVRLVNERLERYAICTTMLDVKYRINAVGYEILTA
jgi:hypothetical protein